MRADPVDAMRGTEATDPTRSRGRRPARRIHAAPSFLASAILIVAPVADLIGLGTEQTWLWATGAHLITAGLAVGLVAAVPGLRAHATLPAGGARRRSASHAALTICALALLLLARWVRGHPEVPPDPPILAAEGLAAALLVVGWIAGRRTRRLRSGVGDAH